MELKDWLNRTTAKELMVRQVVSLGPEDSLAVASGRLLREQVTGAPVLDEKGVCVGVLSASDISAAEGKLATQREKIAASSFWSSNLALPASVYAERLAGLRDKLAPAAEQPVRRFMTTDLVSVPIDASVLTIVQHMVEAHVHRVLVLDRQGRLEGLISATDVMAALLRAGAGSPFAS
jgi:CBS-domain-containing membrane protein